LKEAFSTLKCIKDIKNTDFVRNCGIPLEYVAGAPIFRVTNSKPYLVIPFLRYKMTGVVDKTYVYPIRYTITISIPDKKIVGFEDLSINPRFRKVDFGKPIGLFRHESVKNYTQKQFKDERAKLYAFYDNILTALVAKEEITTADDEAFSALLKVLLEPSLKPIYRVLDKEFFDKYLA